VITGARGADKRLGLPRVGGTVRLHESAAAVCGCHGAPPRRLGLLHLLQCPSHRSRSQRLGWLQQSLPRCLPGLRHQPVSNHTVLVHEQSATAPPPPLPLLRRCLWCLRLWCPAHRKHCQNLSGACDHRTVPQCPCYAGLKCLKCGKSPHLLLIIITHSYSSPNPHLILSLP